MSLRKWWGIYLSAAILVAVIIFGVLTDEPVKPIKQFKQQQNPDLYRQMQYTSDYFACIEDIMMNEDYRPLAYNCAAGHSTIGFGHKIKAGEKFMEPMSFEDAYFLMNDDFDVSIVIAKLYGFKRDDSQQLAVAHAIYCLGQGTTGKIIDSGFTRVIMRYCYYRGKNGMVFNQRIKESREFELNLYKKRY